MNKQTDRITIEIAKNGFLIYINDRFEPGKPRQTPYVFETMESMQKFIKEELTKVYQNSSQEGGMRKWFNDPLKGQSYGSNPFNAPNY